MGILRWLILTVVTILCIYYLTFPSIQIQGMQTSAFSGLMYNRKPDPGDGETDFKTFGTIIYTIILITLGYKAIFESRAIINGECPPCSSCSKNAMVNEGGLGNRLPWTWLGVIVFSWFFWVFAVYIYSFIVKFQPFQTWLSMDLFLDVANHMFSMISISWFLFLLVPIATIILDVTGKLFSNLNYPTQTQIH